ncbi:MAG: hypothetical protein AAB874_06790 [Patescibacteria group bacterium]
MQPKRKYPVTIDPTVIVSGGIAETETQFGGLQRKVAPMSVAGGPNNGATFANDASVGTQDWLTPGNAQTSDDVPTSFQATSVTSKYLKATNFSFSIPSNAVIRGIVMEYERSQNSLASTVFTNSIKLVKAGSITDSEATGCSAEWESTDTYATCGSSVDLWGTTWIESDIENSGFGTVISATGTVDANEGNIDHIRITV